MDEMDSGPQPRVPDSGHYDVASDGGAESWAITASIIETCKLLGVNSQAYITDVLTKIVQGWPNSRIGELMPWAWKPPVVQTKAAA
jgi:transposase